jgi:pimeloyl-ACP methyl ester carboxylesterase
MFMNMEKSDKNPKKYSAKAIAEDLTEFIKIVIGGKAITSGHSSGGMTAVWIAAHSPNLVLGTVIEDSPFFSTEPDRRENTFAWVFAYRVNGINLPILTIS